MELMLQQQLTDGEPIVWLSPTWPIRYRQQKDASGCCIAALAMITDHTYEEVRDYLASRVGSFEQLNSEYVWRAGLNLSKTGIAIMDDGLFYLRDMGFAYQKRYRSPYTTAYGEPLHEPWPCEPWADLHICSVITSQSHAVVLLKNGVVLDPLQPCFKKLTDYQSVEAIIAVYNVGTR